MKQIALVGNPNSGKTTLFNTLTGSSAYVGNWPGVTVDKKMGTYKKTKQPLGIIDLPGIYSLSPYTPEEVIARNYILDEKPDCIINIIDATNMERNLYLTTQLLEINVPVVVALNMMDVVRKSGDSISAAELSRKMGVPVVEISALKEENIHELMEVVAQQTQQPRSGKTVLEVSSLIHLIRDIEIAFKGMKVDNALFHAVKLVEQDELEVKNHPNLVKMVEDYKANFKDDVFGADFEAIVADQRYQYIASNFSSAVKKNPDNNQQKTTKTDKVDRWLTNRFAAIPIFLGILFMIFHLTFSEDLFFLGAMGLFGDGLISFEGQLFEGLFANGGINSPGIILFNFVEIGSSALTELITGALSTSPQWVQGFIGDGVLGGLFAVLSFVPQILVLYLFFSILEDSGYMARVAFILDRIFRRFGLSGRAFMPMIMGFGCSVPAMMNTRTLAEENERVATIRVIPFFSCGAKLPILTAIAGGIVLMFGIGNADLITYSMYLLGIVTAIITILIMRNTTMRGKTPPFIMELPAYHAPQLKSLMRHVWDKLKHFIKKAFTIILASTIVIWMIGHFDWAFNFLPDEAMADSILATIGRFLQPVFTPLGFGSQLSSQGWVFVVAAATGLIAKENVVATFGTLAASLTAGFIGGEEGIEAVGVMIQATQITIPGLLAFIAFNMTTIPCFAACATAKAELPKGKFWTTIAFWVFTSYLVGTMIYVIGTWWWTAFIVIILALITTLVIILYNRSLCEQG